MAPVRYAPGPLGSIDEDNTLSRWKGRCVASAGCGSGTGDMSEEDIDRAIEGDPPVDIDGGGARPLVFTAKFRGYCAVTFRGIAGKGGA